MPSEHDPPLNAVELGRAVAGAQRAADELPSDDARVRRTAALESLAAYAALLTEAHLARKVAALERYASQAHRRYSNEEYIRNVARTHGINVNREYAEVFQVYRVVA